MCGIAGYFSPPDSTGAFTPSERETIAKKMGDALAHRGPDDFAVWQEPRAGVAFSFRRLSILDLSENGRQPMASVSGRYTVEFNGEIYNYLELKKEVVASGKFTHAFRGHSDTEVLLAAFDVWGFEKTLEKTNGMFAIAVWDREKKELLLARDRMGEKPLYYGIVNGSFLFASEMKAFFAVPGFQAEIDRDALTLYFRYGYFPTPYSVFREIKKLTPGHWMSVKPDLSTEQFSYWSIEKAVAYGLNHPFVGTLAEGEKALEGLLTDSISRRCLSDVPLGAFLSGGVDSSLIVALMQQQSASPVKTFTIGFNEKEYDEAAYANAVAKHLKTDHTEHYLSVKEAAGIIPSLADWFDEPLGDASQIPTYLVSRLAKQKVTVALSGDGGDELFAGYPRYVWGDRVGEAVTHIPQTVRHWLGLGLKAIPSDFFEKGIAVAKEFFPLKGVGKNPTEKLRKLAELVNEPDPAALYRTLVSQWPNPTELVAGATEPSVGSRAARIPGEACDLLDKMMYWDQTTYLCDDVLSKVDRASMAVGLEVRVPLLDHRIVEMAWSFPRAWKLQGGTTKAILRQLLSRHVPKVLIDRPKQGFSLPVDHWIRGELKDWAEDLLSEKALAEGGILNAAPVRTIWESHRDGHANHQHALWSVLIFQQWAEKYRRYIR